MSARLAGSITLACAICGLMAPAAGASYPGRNGKIAVIWTEIDRGGRNDTELRFVTDSRKVLARLSPCSRPEFDPPSGSCPASPAWSPDGKRLAFELDERLAVANADGSGIAMLPQLTDSDVDPAWSADGARLVFAGARFGTRDLFVAAADGTGLKRLTFAGGSEPAWSVRDRIAYVSKGTVFILDPATGKRRRLAKGSQPEWSPSGRSVAYKLRKNVYRVPARRGGRRTLLLRNARRPAYSPNGKLLLFERNRKLDFTTSLWLANANGSSPTVLLAGGEQPIGSTYDFWGDAAWRPLP